MNEFQRIVSRLHRVLASPQPLAAARRIIGAENSRAERHGISREKLREKLELRSIELRWVGGRPFRTLVTTSRGRLHPLAIAMGFFDNGYLCCGSALYWNGLSEQVPKHFYVAGERKTPTRRADDGPLDEETIRDEFMKPPRKTQKVAEYGGNRFTLLERAYSNNLGVTGRVIRQGEESLPIRVTNLDRTLIDIGISPHHSGGFQAVLAAYQVARPRWDLARMLDYYDKLDFVYPYWQRIGLLLELAGSSRGAKRWRTHFGPPLVTFYLERGYRSDWPIDRTWKVACPPGFL